MTRPTYSVIMRIADLFQHLFHLGRDGGPKFSLGLSAEMQAIDTIG